MLKNNNCKINIPKNFKEYIKKLLDTISIIGMNNMTNKETNKETNKKNNEVQKHGFVWEKEIIKNVFKVPLEEIKKIKYTNKFDIPAELNHIDGCDISIKTTGNINTVGMADALRVYDSIYSGKSLHLIVLTFKQDKKRGTKTVSDIVEVNLTGTKEMIDILFKDVTREDIEELDNAVKSVPQNRKPTAEEHKAMYTIHKNLISKTGEIYFNIKCNSGQSRLQCSFNKFSSFLEKNQDKIIARTNTNIFRGGTITAQLNSPCREFKKKCKNNLDIVMEGLDTV